MRRVMCATLVLSYICAIFPAAVAAAKVIISINPTSATVVVGGQQQFQATVNRGGVTWLADGIVGGNTSVGTVSTTGLYVAPQAAGNHTVTAHSTADTTKSATAAVQVTLPAQGTMTVDFGARSSATEPIPANMIGAQLGGLTSSTGFQLLQQANYGELRIDAKLQNVFANGTTPDWTQLDPTVSMIQSYGFRPLVVVGYTPSWLQISPNPCPSGVALYHSAPADVNQWAQLATALVAHMDQKFPGVAIDYEIWNEPDTSSGLCVSDGTATTRLNTYIAMYGAAAAAMHTQAVTDHVLIRVGGPVMTTLGLVSTWIPALVGNSNTAPYVDFVSYHHYLAGQSDILNGIGWDNTTGPSSYYSREQSTTSGAATYFSHVSALVKQGIQPNATTTPVFLTEYQDNWAFLNDCCRNSPTYSPLLNALWLADTLNTIYSGTQNVPAKLTYFSASTPSGAFCLAGNIDAAMDCASTTPITGYPQYYTHKLIASSPYMNLNNGGFMSSAISGTPAPLVGTAFYTISGDAILLVNPTSTDYNGLAVVAQNPGGVSQQGTLYILNNANQAITAQNLSFTANGSSLSTFINVPAYTVVGIVLPTGASSGPITVSVSPTSANINVGVQQQFTASVSGTNNTGVTWYVDGIIGGNTQVGTITSGGLFTAQAAGSHTVMAASVADLSKSASAQVSVTSPGSITVTVTPASTSISAAATQQFTAAVPGTTNTAVTCFVDGVLGGNSTTGTITAAGLYTPGLAGQHTVTATSAADGVSSGSGMVTVSLAIAVHPVATSLTITQTQQFTAQVLGATNTSVTWAVDGISGGNSSVGTISAGGLYAPPLSGTHTISATSQADATRIATASIVITPYAGTFTYKYDNGRAGQNTSELLLAPSTVNSTKFGQLFSYNLDGWSWAQPLYVANVNVPNVGYRNLVYVVTMHDSVYAFDADGKSSSPVWKRSFTNAAAGITTMPGTDFGLWYPEIGILSTPVIDSSSGTLYCVAATKENGTHVYRLHALDIVTGAEKFGGPTPIQASVPGTGWNSVNGTVSFSADLEMNRPGLLLSNGIVYMAFGSYANDQGLYHGWLLGYDAQTLQQTYAYTPSANADAAAVWGGGGSVAADDQGNIFIATGNGAFDANTGGIDFGDSFLKLTPNASTLNVTDYFTPYNQDTLNSNDDDLNSGGVTLLPDQPGNNPHQAVVAAKDGNLYVLNRDSLGQIHASDNSQALAVFHVGQAWSSASYWNANVYIATAYHYMNSYPITNGTISSTAKSSTAISWFYPGATPVISANGNSNGILWAHERTGDSNVAVLHAYDATNLKNEVYNSAMAANNRDTIGAGTRFSIPIVANGKVYLATTNRLVVFGLLP